MDNFLVVHLFKFEGQGPQCHFIAVDVTIGIILYM